MKHRLHRLAGHIMVAATMTWLLAGSLAAGANQRLHADRRDRGAVTLEQAIVTAVLSAAAIALGVIIVNAIAAHSGNIR